MVTLIFGREMAWISQSNRDFKERMLNLAGVYFLVLKGTIFATAPGYRYSFPMEGKGMLSPMPTLPPRKRPSYDMFYWVRYEETQHLIHFLTQQWCLSTFDQISLIWFNWLECCELEKNDFKLQLSSQINYRSDTGKSGKTTKVTQDY